MMTEGGGVVQMLPGSFISVSTRDHNTEAADCCLLLLHYTVVWEDCRQHPPDTVEVRHDEALHIETYQARV